MDFFIKDNLLISKEDLNIIDLNYVVSVRQNFEDNRDNMYIISLVSGTRIELQINNYSKIINSLINYLINKTHLKGLS